jgi:ribose transport system substrate-binding protein
MHARKFVIALAALLLVVAGCSQETDPDQTFIGALLPVTSSNSYSAAYVKAMKAEAKEFGVRLKIYDSNFSTSTQAAQADELFAQHPDGVVLWPAEASAVTPILTKAEAADIPILISDSEVPEDVLKRALMYTGPSNQRQGAAAAELMAEALGGKGNVVVLAGVAGNSTSVDRETGFANRLKEIAPDIKILGTQPTDWDKGKAISVTTSFLTKYGSQINGIFATNDDLAAGAAQALSTAGKADGDIKIVGIGFSTSGAKELEKGAMYGTIFQSAVADGEYAVRYLVDALNGKLPEDNRVYIPIPKVTATNMGEYTPEWG